MEAGADDYLIKPFSARELLARCRPHLQMARMRREAERGAAPSAARSSRPWSTRPRSVVYLRRRRLPRARGEPHRAAGLRRHSRGPDRPRLRRGHPRRVGEALRGRDRPHLPTNAARPASRHSVPEHAGGTGCDRGIDGVLRLASRTASRWRTGDSGVRVLLRRHHDEVLARKRSRRAARRCGRPTAARTSSWPCWPTSCATRWPRSATACRS